MNRAKIGVIGLGRFGVQHARVLAQLPQVELTAVCSRSAERAACVASTYNVPGHYTDYRDLIRDPDVEAIDIVTEVDRHTEVALAALRLRKHVFSEILLTDSPDENDRLIDEAEKSGAVFMVGFLERFDVRRANIKQKIDAGELGELVSIYGRRNIWRGILDAPRFKPWPLVLQPGIHTVDQLLWMAERTSGKSMPDRAAWRSRDARIRGGPCSLSKAVSSASSSRVSSCPTGGSTGPTRAWKWWARTGRLT